MGAVYAESVEVEQKGKGEKEEDDTHPVISDVCHDARSKVIPVPFAYPHQDGGTRHENHEDAQENPGDNPEGKGGIDPEKDIDMNCAVDTEDEKKEQGHYGLSLRPFNLNLIVNYLLGNMKRFSRMQKDHSGISCLTWPRFTFMSTSDLKYEYI